MSRHKLPTHCYKLPKLPKVANFSQKMQVTLSFQLLFICFPIAFHSLSPSTFQSVHDRFLIAFKSLYDRFMIAFQSFSNCCQITFKSLSNRFPLLFWPSNAGFISPVQVQRKHSSAGCYHPTKAVPAQQHWLFFSSSSSSSSSKQSIASTAVLSVVL